jgi:hypothetical protein
LTVWSVSFPDEDSPLLEAGVKEHGGKSGFFQFLYKAWLRSVSEHDRHPDGGEVSEAMLRARLELANQRAAAEQLVARQIQNDLEKKTAKRPKFATADALALEVHHLKEARQRELAAKHGFNPDEVVRLARLAASIHNRLRYENPKAAPSRELVQQHFAIEVEKKRGAR